MKKELKEEILRSIFLNEGTRFFNSLVVTIIPIRKIEVSILKSVKGKIYIS